MGRKGSEKEEENRVSGKKGLSDYRRDYFVIVRTVFACRKAVCKWGGGVGWSWAVRGLVGAGFLRRGEGGGRRGGGGGGGGGRGGGDFKVGAGVGAVGAVGGKVFIYLTGRVCFGNSTEEMSTV